MGNKHSSSPLPSYEYAIRNYTNDELDNIRTVFVTIARNEELLDAETISNHGRVSAYSRKLIIPRFISGADNSGKDFLDFEKYVCIITLFRSGSVEDKIKFLFLMYDDTHKGINLPRNSLINMLTDIMAPRNSSITPEDSKFYREWSNDLEGLVEGMADMIMLQYSDVGGALSVSDFLRYAQYETLVQSYLSYLWQLLE